jgi:ubiquitin-conjugating enzyme E2 R
MMSIISLLNEPNTYSPANVDASVMYRRYLESKGGDKEYENIIRKQVLATRADADKDGVVVPQTLEEYCIKTTSASCSYNNDQNDDCILDDLDDVDAYDNNNDDDDDDEENSQYNESNTDSGNEES